MGLDKFSAALDLLKGFNVNLYVGEDVFKGKLIGVETDHVVLETENKYIFYYNIDKIQAITKNTRQFQPEKTTASFQKTQSLKDLLHSFQHTWVTILSINKQRFTGVLSEIDSDFATLINGEERILIKLTHISNILKGFIKEVDGKKSSSKDNEKNGKDSDNKKDSKDKSSSSGDKDDSKKDNSKKDDSKKDDSKKDDSKKDDSKKDDSKKDDSKKEEKSKSGSKESSNSSDKKQKNSSNEDKSTKKDEEAVKEKYVESNNTMVWSQPIKIEAAMVQTKNQISSNVVKSKKTYSEEVKSDKTSTDMKKSSDEKEKKSEEPKSSKSKSTEQSKEVTHVKESTSTQKTDNKPAPPYSLQKMEVKSTKTQETVKAAKSVTTQNQATKKEENKTSDMNTNTNHQNVWKQKEQEQKVFRFAGEPVNRDTQRGFPFAGWPNRNNRTSRI